MNDLTTVELLWLEKRIKNRIRFGRAVAQQIIDRAGECLHSPRLHVRIRALGVQRFWHSHLAC